MLYIAAAGAPATTPKPGGTLKGLERATELGIKAMELEWVQRVPLNQEHQADIRAKAESLAMRLTVHAPYFINLNAVEPEKLIASKERIIAALSMAQIAGAHSVCVHPAFYLKQDPTEVYSRVLAAVQDIMKQKEALFPDVNLGLETMGKHTQFGTLEEVLKISKECNIYPVVDFAHIHARQNGAFNTTEEWKQALELYTEYLGPDSLQCMHMHYSGIEYTAKGERRHLPFEESDANWRELLQLLKKSGVAGSLVCESPLLEQDTLLLQNFYESL
jgi:deoxyribonuclease IV